LFSITHAAAAGHLVEAHALGHPRASSAQALEHGADGVEASQHVRLAAAERREAEGREPPLDRSQVDAPQAEVVGEVARALPVARRDARDARGEPGLDLQDRRAKLAELREQGGEGASIEVGFRHRALRGG
jgi:hypothetical protein